MNIPFVSQQGASASGSVEVAPSETIDQLRAKIAGQLLLEPTDFNLAFNGERLQGDRSAKDSGLTDGATVKVIPPPMIGGASFPPRTLARLRGEATRLRENGVPLAPVTPDRWEGTAHGQGKWLGQKVEVRFMVPADYPDSPPKIYVLGKLQPPHPNIAANGFVCMNHTGSSWNPRLTLGALYDDLGDLFAHPNYNSPVNPAAVIYRRGPSRPTGLRGLLAGW